MAVRIDSPPGTLLEFLLHSSSGGSFGNGDFPSICFAPKEVSEVWSRSLPDCDFNSQVFLICAVVNRVWFDPPGTQSTIDADHNLQYIHSRRAHGLQTLIV